MFMCPKIAMLWKLVKFDFWKPMIDLLQRGCLKPPRVKCELRVAKVRVGILRVEVRTSTQLVRYL